MTQSAEQSYVCDCRKSFGEHCKSIAETFDSDDWRKAAILESSNQLRLGAVTVHKKKDGLLLIDGWGRSRFMTWRERIAFFLLKGNSEIRV